MALSAQDYYKQPTETVDQYNARIAQARSVDLPNAPSASGLLPGTTAPAQGGAFGDAIQGLLQRYQRLGTRPFAEQGFNAQQEQVRRLGQQTPSSLIGAAPDVQSGVRNAAVSAVQPTVTGAGNDQRTFAEQLQGFRDATNQLQSLQESRQKSAQDLVNFAIDSGGASGLQALLDAQPEVLKQAGFDAKTVEKLIPAIRAQEVTKNTGSGGGGGQHFTDTQLNKGAATARIPYADFVRLDDDTKNFFINNASDVNAKIKYIDDQFAKGGDPQEIEGQISASNAPDAVKDTLVRYLWSRFPRP